MVASIRSYAAPQFLYRFRSIGRAGPHAKKFRQELDALTGGYLWGASFNEMNDPMEGFFEIDSIGGEPDRVKEAILQIRESKIDLGLCCFNERADNELMWAHYADQFYGICVAYDFRSLLDGLNDNITFSRVIYSEEIPKTTAGGLAPYGEKVKSILSTKNHRWAYEREWRMFGNPGKNSYQKNGRQVISKVYVGNRMDDALFRRLEWALGREGVQVERIKVEGYAIKLNPPSIRFAGRPPSRARQP